MTITRKDLDIVTQRVDVLKARVQSLSQDFEEGKNLIMGLFDGTISKFSNRLCAYFEGRAQTLEEAVRASAQATDPQAAWDRMRNMMTASMMRELVAGIQHVTNTGE